MHFIAHLMHLDPSLFGSFPVGDFFNPMMFFLLTTLSFSFHLSKYTHFTLQNVGVDCGVV